MSITEYLGSPHVLAGDAGLIAERLLELQARYDIGYFSVPGSAMERFAAVIPGLC